MAAIDEYIAQIQDETLRTKISEEVRKLKNKKRFGLIFEEHLPECTPLWDIPVKKGSKVALKAGQVNDFYTVLKIENGIATCLNKDKSATVQFNVNELVSIAEFGEPIYPYLKPLDTVSNAPDSDLWHTLIEADNYHALQLLKYLYAGKVDCIYIDPPYNKPDAKDWKYNNNYVDATDSYRHSKWLSMMKKRLEIAKDLLDPNESVLIVTIDEKEYLHLGCLLEEIFKNATIQMISTVINPSGSKRLNEFSRNDEYIFFVMIGNAIPCSIKKESNTETVGITWETFRRHDLKSVRGSTKGGVAQFYPLYVNDNTGVIVEIGEPISPETSIDSVEKKENCTTVFPIRDNGIEMNWGTRPETAKKLLEKGYLKAGKKKDNTPQKYVIKYLTSGTINDINTGKAIVDGYDLDGSIIAHYEGEKEVMPKTNWNEKTHNANAYGSKILKQMIGLRFDFPKSLYAVHDTIRFFVANKPNALIVDFFAGSGTTLHAVNLLNAEDGGNRRCILVTNNEVSSDESKSLAKQGYHPGDEEWERIGIARYITWPRTVCSIEGHDINGVPLKGNYGAEIDEYIPDEKKGRYKKVKKQLLPELAKIKFSDGFKANAAYFKLGFLDKNAVALGRQFKEMLPTLWMKAGAHGPCPSIDEQTPEMLILPENKLAVLVDEKAYMDFAEKLDEHPEIETVFIITDSESGYRDMISGLNVKASYQLYRDYLDNFRINAARR